MEPTLADGSENGYSFSELRYSPTLSAWEKVAWLLSIVFHPLLVPSYVFLAILWLSPQTLLPGNTQIQWPLLSLIFLATFVLPALSILSLRWLGQLPNLHMNRLEERRQPFAWVSILYAVLTGFFTFKFPQLPLVNMMLIGITLVIMMVTIISRSWKISAHGAGIGGATGGLAGLMIFFVAPLLLPLVIIFLIISGVVMWARLYLNHHTPEQVWAGWGMGFGVCLGVAAFFESLITYLPVDV